MILEAVGRHAELSAEFHHLITPVTLDSPEAATARENHAVELSYQKRVQTARTLDPPPSDRVERLLTQDEAGDQDAWWRLTLEMTREPTSSYNDFFRSDLTALPGWRDADTGTRARILDAAHRCVLERHPKPEEWFYEDGTTNWPDEAAYKALRLLDEEAGERFEALDPEVWRKWAPVVVGYPAVSRPDHDEAQRRLIGQVYRHAPEELLLWLDRWLVEQNRREHPIVVATLWAEVPGSVLAGVLMERIRDESTKIGIMQVMLDDLLARDVPEAREFAASLLYLPLPDDEGRRGRSLAVARSLLNHASDAGWSLVWPLLHSRPDFGRNLIVSIASRIDRFGSAPLLGRITEAEVADLYLWLHHHIPHHEAPDGFHAIGPLEHVEYFREGVLGHLQGRGTDAALDALARIERELPRLPYLHLVRLEAEKIMMERTWAPHRPENLWTLIGDQRARLVEGGDQLLDVVMESLERFQRKLGGETPASFMLWDKQAKERKHLKTRYRPKEEERLSDAIKLHFVDDLVGRGIVANREVVIRSGTGGKAGERTDIHVDAITRGHRPGMFDHVTVVVEVKGCWNRDILTAMQNQLRDRYLAHSHCRHGLYVVGWFPFEQWDEDDYRRGVLRRQLPMTLAEARDLFARQADEMTGGSRRVDAVVLDCTRS